jgi:alkyl hydroperoxide reductase subunit D
MRNFKMSIETIKSLLPDYAKDVKLNIASVLTEAGSMGLTQAQITGIALASSYATHNPFLIKSMTAYAESHLSQEEIAATKAAAVIMAMNNVYYRFTHLVSDKDYSSMPVKLRMNIMRDPGVQPREFELYSLAISAINGCGLCMDSHVKQLGQIGVSKEAIQSSIRIAAVIQSLAQAILIEAL